MVRYSRPLTFNTPSEEKGTQLMKAFVSMLNQLDQDDIIYLGQLSERKKGWVKKAKPYENFL